MVLKLGYFVGKLGRRGVFALKRGNNLELPSDLSGVVYTPYVGAGGELAVRAGPGTEGSGVRGLCEPAAEPSWVTRQPGEP